MTKDRNLYFVYVPHYHERYFNNKYYLHLSPRLIVLNDSIGNNVVKLHTGMLDKFLEKQFAAGKDFKTQLVQADHLLQPLLIQILNQEVPAFQLTDSLSRRPKMQRDEIMNVINPILSSNSETTWDRNYKVYRNVLGFVLVHFKKSAEDDLKIDLYLIPDRRQYKHYRDIEVSVFSDCLALEG